MVGQGALLPHPLNPGLEGRPSTLLDLVVLLPDEIHVRQLDTKLPRHPTAASSQAMEIDLAQIRPLESIRLDHESACGSLSQ